MASDFLRVFKIVLTALLTIFWPIFVSTLFILFSPLYLHRQIIKMYAKIFRKDLGKMVPARSCILAVDNMAKPECNVVIWFVLEGDINVKEFQDYFSAKVLNLRNPSKQNFIFPEFRQYFHQTLGYLFWKWDQSFDVKNHIKNCTEFDSQNTQAFVTEMQVLKFNEKLLSQAWPEGRSPWKFLLIRNYESFTAPQTLVLFTLHHGMGDGYSFLKLIQNHLINGGKCKTAKPREIVNEGKILRLLKLPFKIAYEFSEQGLSFDFNQWHRAGWKLTREVRVGKTRRIPIAFIKQLKTRYNVSFSAVLSAAVAGGIRKYFLEHGIQVPEFMRVFLPLPFPNHPENKLVTHLTGCYYKLPLGEPTPQKRVEAAHRNFESLRGSAIPLINFYLCLVGGALPSCLAAVHKNYHCTGIFSNFPGDEDEDIKIMGRKVQDFSYNVAYLHGATGKFERMSMSYAQKLKHEMLILGFTITCLSFRNTLRIDLAIDSALAPGKEAGMEIVDGIAMEFDILSRVCSTRG